MKSGREINLQSDPFATRLDARADVTQDKLRGLKWDELTEQEEEDWMNLGWDDTMWNAREFDTKAPRAYSKEWKQLAPRQQQSAQRRGYTPEMWNTGSLHQNMPGAKGAREWDALSANDKYKWGVLGWDAASWNRGDAPESYSKDWNDLTAHQQDAARDLGYSGKTWRPDATPGKGKRWSELTENQRHDWQKLGYGEDAWNNNRHPRSIETPFQELMPDQQLAARNLGYTPDSWDRAARGLTDGWAELVDYADGRHDPIEEWYHHYRADGKRPADDTQIKYAPDGSLLRIGAATVWTPKGIEWASARFDDIYYDHPDLRPQREYSLATHEQLLLIPDLEAASFARYIVHFQWTVKGYEWARPIWGERKPELKAGGDVSEDQWDWLRSVSEDAMFQKYIKEKVLNEAEIEELNRFRVRDPKIIGLSQRDRCQRGWFEGHSNRHEQEVFAFRNLEILQGLVNTKRASAPEFRDTRWTNDPKIFPLPSSVTGEFSELPTWEGGIIPYPPHNTSYFVPKEPRPGTKTLSVYIGYHKNIIWEPHPDVGQFGGRRPERSVGIAKPPPHGNDLVWLSCTYKTSPQYFETPIIEDCEHKEWNSTFTFEDYDDTQPLMFFVCCKSGAPGRTQSRHLFTGELKWREMQRHLGELYPVHLHPRPHTKIARGTRRGIQGCFDGLTDHEDLPDHDVSAVVYVVVDVLKAPRLPPTMWQQLDLGRYLHCGSIKTLSNARAQERSFCLNVYYTSDTFDQLDSWRLQGKFIVIAAGSYYQEGPHKLVEVAKFQDEFNGGEHNILGGEASILIKLERPIKHDHPKGTPITVYNPETFHYMNHHKRVPPDVDRDRRIKAANDSKYVWTAAGCEIARIESWNVNPRKNERVSAQQQAVIGNQLGLIGGGHGSFNKLNPDERQRFMMNFVHQGYFRREPNYVWTRSGVDWARYQEEFRENPFYLPEVLDTLSPEQHGLILRNESIACRDLKNLEEMDVLYAEEFYNTHYIQPPIPTYKPPEIHLTPRRVPREEFLMTLPWQRLTDYGHAAAEKGFAVVFDNTDPEKSNCGRVFQGELDNAYFVEALNAISCRPKLAKQLFYCWDVEKAIFILRINVNGTWVRVEIDDYVPPIMANREEEDGRAAKPSCCYSEDFPFVLWPSLVEKAYAKVHTCRPPFGYSGGWESLGGGGRVEEALADLTGGCAGRFSTSDVSPDRLFLYFYHLQRYCLWVARVSPLECRRHGVNLDMHTAYVVNRAEAYHSECYVQLFSACAREQTGGAGLESYSVPTELIAMFPEKHGGYFWVNIIDFHTYFETVFECRLTNSPSVALPGMPPARLPQEQLVSEEEQSSILPEQGVVRNRGGDDGPYIFFEHLWANTGFISPHTDPEFEIVVPDGACPCEIVAVAQQRTPRTDQIGPIRDEPAAILLKVYQHVEGNCYCAQEVKDEGYHNFEPFARSNYIPIRDAMVCFNCHIGGKFLVTCEMQQGKDSRINGLVFRAYSSVPAVRVLGRVSKKTHKLVKAQMEKCTKWSLVGCKNPNHRLNDKAPEAYNPASDGLPIAQKGPQTNQQCVLM